MSSRHREPPVLPRCGSRRRALLVKSLVGRNPAVSSTTVEATTNFAYHRPPSQKFLGPLRDCAFPGTGTSRPRIRLTRLGEHRISHRRLGGQLAPWMGETT